MRIKQMISNKDYGRKVKIKSKYLRISKYNYGTYSINKSWVIVDYTTYREQGIFLGLRTIASGQVDIIDEGMRVFRPEHYLQAALVSPSPTSNPIYCPLDGIEFIE